MAAGALEREPGVMPAIERLRALIIEDSEACQRALEAVLEDLPELRVVGCAGSGRAGLAAIEEHAPDVVAIDVSLPDISGIEVAAALRAGGKDCGIVFVTSFDTRAHRAAAAELGAGFVVKEHADRDLCLAIRAQYRPPQLRHGAMLLNLIDAASDLFLVLDGHERVIYAGGAAKSVLDAPAGSLSDTPWLELLHVDDVARLRAALADLTAADRRELTLELRLRGAHGTWQTVSARARRLPGDESILLVCRLANNRATSGTSATELDAGSSEARFRQLAETITEVFWMTDTSKRQMLYVSPAYETIWGRSTASLYAAPGSWIDAVHPSDRERVRVAAHSLQAAGTYDITYRIVRPDGAVRWIHDRAYPFVTEAGSVPTVAGIAADVTDRRALERRIEDAQMLAAVGRLATSVAHDFNNLLTVIQCETTFLGQSEGLSEEALAGLREIVTAADHASALTRQMVAYGARHSRDNKDAKVRLDLGDAATRMARLLGRVMGEDVDVLCFVEPDTPPVSLSPTWADQIVTNLMFNARDAMPRGGQLTVRVGQVGPGEVRVPSHLDDQGRWVELRVGDTGEGIPSSNLGRIFEPHFTTKGPGKGTGLGLATVAELVRDAGGWIDVASVVGTGTTFRIYLPPADRASLGA